MKKIVIDVMTGESVESDLTEQELLEYQMANAAPSHSELVSAIRKKAAELRLSIASILSDLQIDALVDGDMALASTIKTLKDGLSDVVNMDLSQYTTAQQMESAIQYAYYQLALSAPEELRAAFRSLVP